MYRSCYRFAIGLLALASVVAIAAPAEAVPRHPEVGISAPGCSQPEMRPCEVPAAFLPAVTRRHQIEARNRPARWCGWFMAKHLGITGKLARSLWVARKWADVGAPAHGPRVGAIVVWRHHVGKITAVRGKHIRVLSGNDGHAVRDRWRTTAGVIAYRWPPPGSWAG